MDETRFALEMLMPTIYLRAGKLPFDHIDVLTSLRKNVTGTNVGNMLFQQSVFRSLYIPGQKIKINGYGIKQSSIDEINETASALVLPLANQFRPHYAERLDGLSNTISKLKVPVIVVGVGCQADLNYNFELLRPMDEQVKRFVSAVLDRSASIGVRGECTKNYLNALGFSAVDVIGCPSMFMYGADFPVPRQTDLTYDSKIAVNISAAGEQAKFAADLDRMGLVIDEVVAKYKDVVYIPQENRSLEDMMWFRERARAEHSEMSPETYRKLRDEGRIKAFVDPKTWFDYLSTRDFAFGTRLHGSIAALLAGTPAHLVAHDSRTLELADYFDIPSTKITSDEKLDPIEVYARSDFSKMISGHGARFDAYKAFLTKNGLRHIFDTPDGGQKFDERLRKAKLAPVISSTAVIGKASPAVKAAAKAAAAPRPAPKKSNILSRGTTKIVSALKKMPFQKAKS